MKPRFAFASLAVLAFASPAAAQQVAQINEAAGLQGAGAGALPATLPPVTQITPDSVPGRTLGTTVTPAGTRYEIDGGARTGANLFHSFAHFDLGQGDTAAWIRGAGDGAQIEHVVNRVTGGEPSLIFGTIDSTALPNADFWFINPSGILFGEGARLDVPAAAFFSTAQELRFASGPAFTIATPTGSTLSVAPPTAFGFLGGQASIALVAVGGDFLRPPGLLLLAGSDVVVQSSLFAAGDMRLYGIGDAPAAIEIAAVRPLDFTGRVDIADSRIALAGLPGIESGVRIVAGSIDISRSDVASLAAFDVGFGASILLQAEEVTVDGSFLSSATRGTADAGNLSIFGDRIRVNGSFLTSEAGFGATGAAGNITIAGDSVIIEDGSFVTSSTLSDRPGGAVRIAGRDIDIDFSVIGSNTDEGVGAAGVVEITGATLSLSGAGLISSSTAGDGAAGAVLIDMTERVDLDFAAIASSSTASFNPDAVGESGTVLIRTPVLTLASNASINTSTSSRGDAGLVSILADDIALADDSSIESRADGRASGDAGLVLIQSLTDGPSRLVMNSGAEIRSDTAGDGDAGGIFIDIDEIDLFERVKISSSATRSFGDPLDVGGSAGAVQIRANRVTMRGSEAGAPRIESESTGRGAAGLIQLDVGRLDMAYEAVVSTATRGTGAGGGIDVNAGEVALASRAIIASSTSGSGNAGTVSIDANSVALQGGAQVSTSALRESGCDACARPTGNAGSVGIIAERVDIAGGSLVSSSTGGAGDAGTIGLQASSLRLDDGRISTSTLPGSTGGSGTVVLDSRTIDLVGDSGIETISNNANEAGGILIATDRLTLTGPSARITSSNLFDSGGDAGGIFISAGDIVLLGGARLTSSSVSGAAGTIEIFMPEDAFLLLDSTGPLSLITTSSGPGTGGRIIISNPFAIISNGGAILSLGDLGGANVEIATRFFISSADRPNLVLVDGSFLLEAQVGDVSSGTVERDLSVVDASGVLRGQCAAVRATGQVSQLIVRPTGPYGTRPEGGAAPSDSCF